VAIASSEDIVLVGVSLLSAFVIIGQVLWSIRNKRISSGLTSVGERHRTSRSLLIVYVSFWSIVAAGLLILAALWILAGGRDRGHPTFSDRGHLTSLLKAGVLAEVETAHSVSSARARLGLRRRQRNGRRRGRPRCADDSDRGCLRALTVRPLRACARTLFPSATGARVRPRDR